MRGNARLSAAIAARWRPRPCGTTISGAGGGTVGAGTSLRTGFTAGFGAGFGAAFAADFRATFFGLAGAWCARFGGFFGFMMAWRSDGYSHHNASQAADRNRAACASRGDGVAGAGFSAA
ncbi:MAG: hypothetical protein ACT4UP_04270 [Gammaproteobacteria bacterium]